MWSSRVYATLNTRYPKLNAAALKCAINCAQMYSVTCWIIFEGMFGGWASIVSSMKLHRHAKFAAVVVVGGGGGDGGFCGSLEKLNHSTHTATTQCATVCMEIMLEALQKRLNTIAPCIRWHAVKSTTKVWTMIIYKVPLLICRSRCCFLSTMKMNGALRSAHAHLPMLKLNWTR